jgi:hypothetical protein
MFLKKERNPPSPSFSAFLVSHMALFVPYGKCNAIAPHSSIPSYTWEKKDAAFVNWCELQPHFAL